MALSKERVAALLAFVAETRDEEITCDECLEGMAEFAETEIVGAAVPEALARIKAHIEFCPECKEEYLLLHSILEQIGG